MKSDNFPYDTRLDVKFGSLELIDERALTDAVTHPWFNQTLCAVNESVIRVCALKGEYHWHKHDNDDEFFYVVDGELLVDFRDRTVTLERRQGIVVPKGIEHRTRAVERAMMLAVDTKAIIPTGD